MQRAAASRAHAWGGTTKDRPWSVLGRFIEAKGLELLMRVLDETASPWRALFVGGGPLEPVLRQWAARHGGRTRIVAGVPHDRVPEHLNAIDILVGSQPDHGAMA